MEFRSGERKLISQLKSGNAEQRYEAIRSLEQNGSNRAREVVAEHLQDSDPNVAGRAALALGAMGQPENIQRLTQATGDQRAEVRQAAFVALGRTAGKVPIDYQKLIRALETDESAAVRAAAALALGRLHVWDAGPSLIAAFRDPGPFGPRARRRSLAHHVGSQFAVPGVSITGRSAGGHQRDPRLVEHRRCQRHETEGGSSAMKSRTTHAYTLIEVLTVITITGVLAALLLPSLRNMREQARKAQCLGNLHQLYLAYFNRKADEGFGVVRRLQNFPSHAMLLAGVLNELKVFLCPSDHSPHWAGCGAIIETYDGNAGVNARAGEFSV